MLCIFVYSTRSNWLSFFHQKESNIRKIHFPILLANQNLMSNVLHQPFSGKTRISYPSKKKIDPSINLEVKMAAMLVHHNISSTYWITWRSIWQQNLKKTLLLRTFHMGILKLQWLITFYSSSWYRIWRIGCSL